MESPLRPTKKNMIEADIVKKITDQFPQIQVEWVQPEIGDAWLFVPAASLHDIIKFLRDTWELAFDSLMSLAGIDTKENVEVVYHLYSYRHRHRFVVKTKADRLGGAVPSIHDLYGTADFQEREAFDMLGVRFTGHPNLKRILLPQDWVGHPLLKDYVEQEEYNGISTTRKNLIDG